MKGFYTTSARVQAAKTWFLFWFLFFDKYYGRVGRLAGNEINRIVRSNRVRARMLLTSHLVDIVLPFCYTMVGIILVGSTLSFSGSISHGVDTMTLLILFFSLCISLLFTCFRFASKSMSILDT